MVVALGGNAILRKGDRGCPEEMWRNVYRAAEPIVDLYLKGYRVVITHGNAPQVGSLMEMFEMARDKIPPLTLDIATAMTQGWIGYMLQQAIGNTMARKGVGRRAVTLINQVLVDPKDPAFRDPEKPIGPWYGEEEAMRLAREKGWIFKNDPRGGLRRVVPSPEPLENLEAGAIADLLDRGYIVIACGGGGVPVYKEEPWLVRGVDAVIDKDLASSLLAVRLKATGFYILTDVDYVYIDYGGARERPIRKIKALEAIKLVESGTLHRGSIGPKVRAAALYALKVGRAGVIGSLDRASEVFEGVSGTVVEP